MGEVVNVFMRWLHLSSMAALIGGILYARLVSIPAAAAVAVDAGNDLAHRAAARARLLVMTSIAALTVSGIYTIMSIPGHTPRYHAWLGVKLLLAAHVFAVSLAVTRPENPRRTRLLTGTLISGLAVVLIAAYLRRIF